jgi:NAD(P)H-quinone oxidoreductase subunit N
MFLLTTGKSFIRDLEKNSVLSVYAPLEGGFEGRFERRLRANGYTTMKLTARGLGDVAMYLTGVHGVRPPHLGKKNIGKEGAVGNIYYVPPILSYQLEKLPPRSKGLVLWLIEGHVLSNEELEYLLSLPAQNPQLKIVIEMGGERFFRWQPLQQSLMAA